MNARICLAFAVQVAAAGLAPLGSACGGGDFVAYHEPDASTADATGDVSPDLSPILCPHCMDNPNPPDAGVEAGDEATLDATDADASAVEESETPSDASDAGTFEAEAADASETSPCSSPNLTCDGGCLSPTDVHSCGSCSNDCTLLANVSAAGLSCRSGQCVYTCGAGHADCSDAGKGCATDLTASPNCGGCASTCPSSAPLCAPTGDAGEHGCVTGCPSSAPMLCGSSCVDEQSDSNNCGACGMKCSGGETCQGGACACSAGEQVCGGACTNVQTDNANCGACGTKCGSGTMCSSGQCVCNATSCPNGCCAANTCATMPTWYQDSDGDKYGSPSVSVASCVQPSGYVADHTDCCDSDPNANPGVGPGTWFVSTDNCGSYDYNCDGRVEVEYHAADCSSFSCTTATNNCNVMSSCGCSLPNGQPTSGCEAISADVACGQSAMQYVYYCTPHVPNPPNTDCLVAQTTNVGVKMTQACH